MLIPMMADAFDQAAVGRLLAGDKNLAGADLTNMETGTVPPGSTYNGVDFTGADFSGSRLLSFIFQSCKLAGARLDRANLHGARFTFCNLEGASFAGADMTGTIITGSNLKGTKLTGVTVNQYEAQFGNCDCQNLSMSGTNWGGLARFQACEMRGVDFRSANITGISLENSKIPLGQRAYLATQNIRLFETIQWQEPTKYDFKAGPAKKIENLKPPTGKTVEPK
jgi:uncharacterized protein YjbI with pentapeptide repeats